MERLRLAATVLSTSPEPESYQAAYAQMIGAVKVAARFIPAIVRVVASTEMEGAADRLIVSGQFEWTLHEDVPELDRISIEMEAGLNAPLSMIYLPPGWRRGNRTYYRESKRSPVFAATREVAWTKWDKEAANAVWLRVEGISWGHLERAIELASRSKSEASGAAKARPRVGAVIIKDGRVLGEASRNQDERGGHAEELALSSVKSEDRKHLAGAIVVTTLEPCISGRSPGKMECTVLLLKNGIGKVVIGMLDPNREILGVGYRTLVDNGVDVAFFPSVLHARIWDMNKEFVEAHLRNQVRPLHLPWAAVPEKREA